MIARLFAWRVKKGKTTFKKVPAKLQATVAEILISDFGLPDPREEKSEVE